MLSQLDARFAVSMVFAFALALGGCPSQPVEEERDHHDTGGEQVEPPPTRERQPPPVAGPAADVHLPAITHASTASGLQIDTVPTDGLPVVYLRLVVRSGLASDPEGIPGLSHLVAEMLKEGTRRKTSAQLAESVEFLGAHLDVGDDESQTVIQMRGLAEHLPQMMELLGEVVTTPRFDEQELRRLRQRELDRLQLAAGDPSTLARREMYRILYAGHPYAHVDATPEGIRAATRRDLQTWHRDHYVPNNSFLVVVGNVTPQAVQAAAERAFRGWRSRPVADLTFPAIPQRTTREVVVVHRPGSQQSVIAIGNVALPRGSSDWVALEVANQVLGGSAAARLFMDLRERRSLTYGAYSGIDALPQPGPFRARAGVGRDPRQPDVDRTPLAMDAFMEHLHRIVTEAPPQEELAAAQRYLGDSFPLQIETPARIAGMVAELRLYGLPDDYWDTYRTQIRSVTPAQALAAARQYIQPDAALIVVVGDATVITESMRRWGPVRVIDENGQPIAGFESTPAAAAQ